MSTDDSISEDVSSSVALSPDHVENGEGSMVSSEDAVSGLAAPGEERVSAQSVQTLEGILTAAAGTVKNRGPVTPASNSSRKNRSLHLDVEGSRGSLTAINPSALETLTALVQEIQSSGGTDPQIWRDCEGRWLQLFQLVEKQYRDQILAQHEQYQCQIQLIQDEIKALVQLQIRSRSGQNPLSSQARGAGDSPLVRLLNSDLPGPLVAPNPSATSPSRAPTGEPHLKAPQASPEEGAMTVSSSGYGTLSTWGPSPHWGGEGGGQSSAHGLRPTATTPDSALMMSPESQRELPNHASPGASLANHSPSAPPHEATGQLTSWVQKRRLPRSRAARERRPPRAEEEEEEEESRTGSLSTEGDCLDEYRPTEPSSSVFPLKRSDSLVSEVSGLTYWRLDEGELYRPLPDSFDSGACLLLQSLNQTSQDDPKLPVSLKEIYQLKQAGQAKTHDWDSFSSNASAPQVLTLDPTPHTKQSDRTSGFSSPSHFSSLSSPQQPPPGRPPGAPALTPDSMSVHRDPPCASPALSTASTPTEGAPDGTPAAPVLPQPVSRGDEEASRRTVLASQASARAHQSGGIPERTASPSSYSLEDPVVQSLLRQSLKEKHSRHVADLRAYYESEISSLKEQLAGEVQHSDLERGNQNLLERCEHLDRALTEASACIRDLETKNYQLQSQLEEWPERYAAADVAVQALRARLEDSDRSAQEKDSVLGRLQSRLQELEEELEGASRVSHDHGAQMRKGHNVLHELLAEYDSLRKDHERVKDNLVSAENKLYDANAQISELKRLVSKLESQIKQLEHENLMKTRHMIQSRSQPCGLSQQPDLLLSPSTSRAHLNGDRKWPSPEPDPSARFGPDPDRTATYNSRCYSPPGTPTPLMKALIRMEESRGREGHALHTAGLGGRRPTVSFVDGSGLGPAHLRAQRSLSPEGYRSSSLPPCSRRSATASTPTKREMLLTPLSAKSSPKRCPTENYSTAFGESPVQQLYSHTGFTGICDQTDPSSASLSRGSSLRKRLQFSSDGPEGPSSRPGQEEQGGGDLPDASDSGLPSSYLGQVQSLADTERLFDELTQEKQQIEAELSRIPGAGSRVTMQTRLDEVALEKRLEKVNHDLGSIRITLKRFHVLRSSTNL